MEAMVKITHLKVWEQKDGSVDGVVTVMLLW